MGSSGSPFFIECRGKVSILIRTPENKGFPCFLKNKVTKRETI